MICMASVTRLPAWKSMWAQLILNLGDYYGAKCPNLFSVSETGIIYLHNNPRCHVPLCTLRNKSVHYVVNMVKLIVAGKVFETRTNVVHGIACGA